MMVWVTGLVAGVAFVLSGIHLYWMAGGRWGSQAAIPSTGGASQQLFLPSRAATFTVALLLAIMGVFVLELGGYGPGTVPGGLLSIGGWLLTSAFTLRSIGDFRYMGFFKRVRGTTFAMWDSLLFSPLCLLLGCGLLTLTLAL